MKNADVIDRVKALYNEKNMQQEDKILTNRQIFNKLISSRARVLSQALDSYKTLSQNCYQTILVELQLGDSPYDTNTQLLRSQSRVPSIITERNKPVIQSVSNINNTLVISPLSQENVSYVGYNKYTGKDLYYYFSNSYLYIKNSDLLKSVVLTAVFFNPLDIPGETNFLEREFPVDASMLDSIVTLALQELLVGQAQKQDQPSEAAR